MAQNGSFAHPSSQLRLTLVRSEKLCESGGESPPRPAVNPSAFGTKEPNGKV